MKIYTQSIFSDQVILLVPQHDKQLVEEPTHVLHYFEQITQSRVLLSKYPSVQLKNYEL